MGDYNSSITRVRPFFKLLLRNDPTGSWLKALLKATAPAVASFGNLLQHPGGLQPCLLQTRPYDKDRELPQHGIKSIQLENCFEYELPPPFPFAEWLIQNPGRLEWPLLKSGQRKRYGADTQRLREELVGCHGAGPQLAVQRMALSELRQLGVTESQRKWWAFEGFTCGDAYWETDHLILLVEGKRTEPLSCSTAWFPTRSQIIRNLEVIKEIAAQQNKQYAVVLMAEKAINLSPRDAQLSLPHYGVSDRSDLMSHYLGCITWQQACSATGIGYNQLPNTISDAIAMKLI